MFHTVHRQNAEIISSKNKFILPQIIISGSARLDILTPDGRKELVSLAVKDDVIGLELLIDEVNCYSITALSMCVTIPWLHNRDRFDEHDVVSIIKSRQDRIQSLMRLRESQPTERILQFIILIGIENSILPNQLQIDLPQYQQIAEITNLPVRSVSKTMALLKNEGLLNTDSTNGAHINSKFVVNKTLLESFVNSTNI